MVTSPCITIETPEDLRRLIESHHKDFQTEYPKASMKPKLHNMCHFLLHMHKFRPGRIFFGACVLKQNMFFSEITNGNVSKIYPSPWLCGQMRTALLLPLGQVSDSFL